MVKTKTFKYLKKFKINPISVFLITLIIQLIVTYIFTKTKRFSIRALVRNLSIAFAIYYSIVLKNYLFLFLPIILEITIEFFKYSGYDMDPYVATEYQYSDFWIDRFKKNPLISNFSEANFDGVLGFNTANNSSENNEKIYEWCKYAYFESLNKPKAILYDMNNKLVPEPKILKKIVDDKKFELISKKCNIKPGMRILEIGFGNGDFMDYIYEHYKIRPIGVSIGNEQVKAIRNRGFEAHYMNSWDMTPEKLGTFDVILHCGNLEYNLRSGQNPEKVYTKFCNIINRILKPKGVYFITCCHMNNNYKLKDWINFDYYLHIYFLWAGNDGWYPSGNDGFSKYANKVGLKTIYQEERTHDYYINMNLFFSYFQSYNGSCVTSFTFPSLFDALFKTIAGPYYIHTYLCYLSTKKYVWVPFLWEFTPQNINGIWEPPVSLQYIMFEKE
jgi:cyclopropane fatty-acyl-phospholipid synthase-like methyltransferase